MRHYAGGWMLLVLRYYSYYDDSTIRRNFKSTALFDGSDENSSIVWCQPLLARSAPAYLLQSPKIHKLMKLIVQYPGIAPRPNSLLTSHRKHYCIHAYGEWVMLEPGQKSGYQMYHTLLYYATVATGKILAVEPLEKNGRRGDERFRSWFPTKITIQNCSAKNVHLGRGTNLETKKIRSYQYLV